MILSKNYAGSKLLSYKITRIKKTFAILDKAKPNTKYRRLKLDSRHVQNCSVTELPLQQGLN
jgi:hypothetical protein